jgi:hypothetical protein
MCTSCPPGSYLSVSDTNAKTGTCSPKQAGTQAISLTVTGDRTTAASSPLYPDLMSALRDAYSLTAALTGGTVNILLRTGVSHFILVDDLYTRPEQSTLVSPMFALNIM